LKQFRLVLFETSPIVLPGHCRVDPELTSRFEINKQRRFIESEGEFRRVKYAQNQHVVSHGSQPCEAIAQSIDGGQQIGQQDNQPAPTGES